MITAHQHTTSNIPCNSCTTTLPTPLMIDIGLDHHLNNNHQPQIALLASSASIELVSSSTRVTSVKFHKVQYVRRELERPRPIDRTPETPGSSINIFRLEESRCVTSHISSLESGGRGWRNVDIAQHSSSIMQKVSSVGSVLHHHHRPHSPHRSIIIYNPIGKIGLLVQKTEERSFFSIKYFIYIKVVCLECLDALAYLRYVLRLIKKDFPQISNFFMKFMNFRQISKYLNVGKCW